MLNDFATSPAPIFRVYLTFFSMSSTFPGSHTSRDKNIRIICSVLKRGQTFLIIDLAMNMNIIAKPKVPATADYTTSAAASEAYFSDSDLNCLGTSALIDKLPGRGWFFTVDR